MNRFVVACWFAIAAAGCAGGKASSKSGSGSTTPVAETKSSAKKGKAPTRSASSSEALELLRQAGLLSKRGAAHYGDALSSLRHAQELDPKLWEAVYDEGWILLAQGRPEAALGSFEKAAAMSGGRPACLEALSETQERLGRVPDAIKTLEPQLDKLKGQDALDLKVRIGGLYRRSGKHDEALNVLRQVLQRDPRSIGALSELAQVYAAKQKPELAELILRKALELDDKSKRAAVLWNNLGLIALERRRDQEAFAHFAEASRLDPSLTVARRNRALVYLDAGDYGKASSELNKVTTAAPDDVQAWIALGVAERGAGNLKAANAAYDKALALAPDNADALWDAAILAQEFQKAPERALPLFERFLKVAPSSHPRRNDAQTRKKELESKLAPAPAATPAAQTPLTPAK